MTDSPGPIVYPREAVLLRAEVAAALRVSERTIERSDLPVVYLTDRNPRYVWGEVLDALAARARKSA